MNRKVYVHVKGDRPDAVNLGYAIKGVLHEKGWELSTEVAPDLDLAIAIGGDGTVLELVSMMGKHQAPVIGINKGSIGFLADIDPDEAIDFVSNLSSSVNGIYYDEHLRIRSSSIRGRGAEFFGETIFPDALNEVAILSDRVGKSVGFVVTIDHVISQEFVADGVIINTPTGSTAYAMSAGGSIIDPHAGDCIGIVPVAPYLLSSRPVIVNTNRRVSIKLRDGDSASVIVDGKHVFDIESDEVVWVSKSMYPAKFVNTGYSFFSKVGDKLRRR